MQQERSTDIAVVGGGLAGLAAAGLAARGRARVTLFEKAGAVGGRAVTQRREGFSFNIGPHALYCAGDATSVLRELGVTPAGKRPPLTGAYAVARGRRHALPGGFVSLLTTSLLSLPGKLEVGRLLGSLARLDTSGLHDVPVAEGIARIARRDEVRELVAALVRVATYANAPELQSAGAAFDQLKSAFGAGVLYLDDGWQTLVDGLRDAAVAAGAKIASAARVDRLQDEPDRIGLRLADGSTVTARAVILAIAPEEVRDLLPPGAAFDAASRWSSESVPVRAACLDVALSQLPDQRAGFALGIDRPLYLSVHSNSARLAPQGGALIHVAKYLDPSHETDPAEDERELVALMERMQPGWTRHVVHRRFLPRMTVANAVATARAGGLRGRPRCAIPGLPGAFVAGDWVGPDGMLADASLASARAAAGLALARVVGTGPRAVAA
ncbi:MAG TPA: FAD-dependent oxidoreductase [Candidatus Binatia bacterium]|nr:FAD-dependent oxidoreductase [Candidatus Binatia bacterium]